MNGYNYIGQQKQGQGKARARLDNFCWRVYNGSIRIKKQVKGGGVRCCIYTIYYMMTTKKEREAYKKIMLKIRTAKLPKGWSRDFSYPKNRIESWSIVNQM